MQFRDARGPLGLVLIALTAGALAAGCGGGNKSSGGGGSAPNLGGGAIKVAKRTIGVVDIIRQSPIDDKTDTLMEAAAQKLGWDIKVIDAGGDPGKAASATQSFVNQGVDAIILTSVDANLVRAQLARAKQKNIPVIHTNSGTEQSDLWTAAYMEDETKMASTLVQYIIDHVPNTKLIDLKTTLNFAGSVRAQAVKDTVAASGGKAQIVGSSDVDLSNPAVNTQKDLTDLLTAHPDANAVHAVFDNMAQAAVTTVKLKRSKAQVFSYFSTANNMKNLVNDTALTAVMDNDLAKTGAVAFDELIDYFQKKDPIDPNAMSKPANALEYRVIDRAAARKLGASGDPFPIEKTLAPYLARWAKEYPG